MYIKYKMAQHFFFFRLPLNSSSTNYRSIISVRPLDLPDRLRH